MPRDRAINTPLDMDKIAEALGAERRGSVTAGGGYFGAMQLVASLDDQVRSRGAGSRPKNRVGRSKTRLFKHR